MISRLTSFAALFAVTATALLAFAASSHGQTPARVAEPMPVVQLEPVRITVKRQSQPTIRGAQRAPAAGGSAGITNARELNSASWTS